MIRQHLTLAVVFAGLAMLATPALCDPPGPVPPVVVPAPREPAILVAPVPVGPAMPAIIDAPIDPAIIDKVNRGTIKVPVTWPPEAKPTQPFDLNLPHFNFGSGQGLQPRRFRPQLDLRVPRGRIELPDTSLAEPKLDLPGWRNRSLPHPAPDLNLRLQPPIP